MKNTGLAAGESLLSRAIKSESDINRAISGIPLIPAQARQALKDQAALLRVLAGEIDSLRHVVAAFSGEVKNG